MTEGQAQEERVRAEVKKQKKAKIRIEYGPTSEPWGVRRFFVRNPFGKLVNILVHERGSHS